MSHYCSYGSCSKSDQVHDPHVSLLRWMCCVSVLGLVLIRGWSYMCMTSALRGPGFASNPSFYMCTADKGVMVASLRLNIRVAVGTMCWGGTAAPAGGIGGLQGCSVYAHVTSIMAGGLLGESRGFCRHAQACHATQRAVCSVTLQPAQVHPQAVTTAFAHFTPR